MSDDLKARVRAMLHEVRSAPSGPPRVEEHDGHIVVKGQSDPLRGDFASSGFEVRKRAQTRDLVPADAD